MPRPLPEPQFWEDTKVRYNPLVVTEALAWQARDPWRIIGLSVSRFVEKPDEVRYFLQPWILTGHWAHDRPFPAWEAQLTLWPEEPTNDDAA